MDTIDYVVNSVLSIFLIVGAYQFYFWCQRNYVTEPRQLKLPVDDWIPFHPHWVWIYSFLYYPGIIYLNWTIASARHFTHVASSYLLLLLLQMLFFLLFPVATPGHWREFGGRDSLSGRFLALVQRFDAESNSFPSMHTSVAMLTALHFLPSLGAIALLFPVLIGLSCLFTKQHYVVDVPAGAVLGWLSFRIYELLL